MDYFEKCAIIIDAICDRIEPGKKMIQKLVYFMERKGLNLGLNYSIHYFGPYSAKLDSTLHTLESFEAIEIDTSGMTHVIHKGILPTSGVLDAGDSQVFEFVLDKFLGKTALELEALSTLDYAANSILKGKYNDDSIVNQVLKIKGTKFSKEYLEDELQFLKKTGYIC